MKMLSLLVGLVAWFLCSCHADAQKLQWSYEVSTDFPVFFSTTDLRSVKADPWGGAVIVVNYIDDTNSVDTVGSRVTWISSVGKIRGVYDFMGPNAYRVMKVTSNSFYLYSGGMLRFSLKARKLVYTTQTLPAGDRIIDEETVDELPDSTGYFIETNGPSARFLKLTRYKY